MMGCSIAVGRLNAIAVQAFLIAMSLKRHLSDEQIVELFFVITTYRMHGMMLRALHLEFDNDTTARMEEVPGPAVNMQDVPGSRER